MSTEIKNTLFRFVSMRAPELSEETGREARFVFMPPSANPSETRPFEDAVTAGSGGELSKWSILQSEAAGFTPLSIQEIKAMVGDITYNFAVWIAKNKLNFSHAELVGKLSGNEPLSVNKRNLLWNNLFYQVITQKDFQAKEAVMQLLVANHVLSVKDTIDDDEALSKIYLNAKIVLPKALFIEDDGSTNSTVSKMATAVGSNAFLSVPSASMKKALQNHQATDKLEQLKALKKELLKVEKKHQKAFKAAYDEALEEYNQTVKDLLETYQSDVETARESWCTLQGEGFTYDPQNPCNQPPKVPYPEIPKFEFSFTKEMDFEYLNENLSPENFKLLLEFLEIDFEVDVAGKADPFSISDESGDGLSFGQAQTTLGGVIAQYNEILVNNSPTQGNTAVSVGGVVVPVSNTPPATPFAIQVCPSRTDDTHYGFHLTVEVPDENWDIDTTQSTYKLMGGTLGILNLEFLYRNGNTILLQTNEMHPYTDYLIATSFDATLTFTNGVQKEVSFPTTPTESIFKSCATLHLADIESGGGAVLENFIPSGFGFRQIGIADYKKVEQTTQGYVEGDVAHIENVMAREYKEKATRKLRRSENTTTKTSESEKEKLSDTTSTDRFEMHSEIAKIIQEDRDFGANAGTRYKSKDGSFELTANVNMASHSSNQTSTMNAIDQAKEITERAMERIVTKVKEERIEKIIEEFEENNKHGFDNTKGDKHVVGVFRWVDKVYKNQVYNYGKRLMFEFMVPQPSKLHLLGMQENRMGVTLTEPVDPRKYVDLPNTPVALRRNLENFTLINDNTVKYWGGIFNVELTPCPDNEIKVGKSFAQNKNKVDGGFTDSKTETIQIPEGYLSHTASMYLNDVSEFGPANGLGTGRQNIAIAGHYLHNHVGQITNVSMPNYKGEFPVAYFAKALHASSASIELVCRLSPEARQKWQQETFKAIIDAYEDALVEYNQKLAEENALGIKIKGENPGFYRQIENMVLRKNCISYLISQDPAAARTYGKDMFKAIPSAAPRNFGNHEVNVSAALDDYSGFVKFMEQAFEWEIMSYNFYPYYWGKREDWASLYQYDNNDPLFRNFMQAGMARVIVTVRPGFEEAVRFYMQTGQIWNGGEVPVIEEPLFLSIVDELRAPKGLKEGKAWATRLPTALTILQANSIGLNVTKALPFDDDALNEFENPDEVPVSEGLELTDTALGNTNRGRIVGRIEGAAGTEAKIILKTIDSDELRELTYCDANGDWELPSVVPGTYKLYLDANDDFPNTDFEVLEGEKIVEAIVVANQLLEVNLKVAPLS